MEQLKPFDRFGEPYHGCCYRHIGRNDNYNLQHWRLLSHGWILRKRPYFHIANNWLVRHLHWLISGIARFNSGRHMEQQQPFRCYG